MPSGRRPPAPPEESDPDFESSSPLEDLLGAEYQVRPSPLGLDDDMEFVTEEVPPSAPLLPQIWVRPSPRRRRRGIGVLARGSSPGGQRERAGDSKSESEETRLPTRTQQTVDFLREQLSPENLSQLDAMLTDPRLALTVGQQVLIRRIGQYGAMGDRSGVKRALTDLVEQLGVSSPKNGAVLDGRGATTTQPPGADGGGIGTLEGGKQTVSSSPGARVLKELQPILAGPGGFGDKGLMDRAWRRLTERFGQQAEGTVDVIVTRPGAGPGASESPTSPVGVWSPPAAASAAPAVGVWTPPEGAGTSPAIGEWSPPEAPPAGKPTPAVGQWTPPDGIQPASASGAHPVGQWQAPPDSAANPPKVGQWTDPTESGAIRDRRLGQWTPPDPAPAVEPSGRGSPGGAHPPRVGQWTAGDDVAIGPDLKLSEILEKNPNISDVRLVEVVSPATPGKPAKLQAVLQFARSVLAERFGFR